MNKREFEEWWIYHTTKYPGLINWLRNNFPAERSDDENTPTQSEIRKSWYEDLRSFSLDDCTRASQSMHIRGVRAGGFGEHPRVIRSICRSGDKSTSEYPKPVYRNGRWLVNCKRCENVWVVSVWHPETVATVRGLIRHGKTPKYHGKGQRWTCAVACDCEWGRRRNERLKKPNVVYDESNPLMLITDESRVSFDELVAACEESLSVTNTANYESSFADYNNS